MQNSLQNYYPCTVSIGIMCGEYKPTITANGVEKKQLVRCCIVLHGLAAQPELQPA